jgi:peptidoglycan/LPS O-acetylase OafA/YrhL
MAIAKNVFRPDIEGLRAAAILLVVAFHAGIPGIRGGFVGVDVFFVISGYLITGLLTRELERSGRIDFLSFYGRRVRRLLPGSCIVVVTTLAIGRLVLSPSEQLLYGRTALSTSLYLSNFFFIRNSLDYFGQEITLNPLLHTWSLSVEEQFYLLWPLVLLASFLLWKNRKGQASALLGLSVISFASCVWLTGASQAFAFYSPWTRAWEFGLGGLANLIPCARWSGLHSHSNAIAWVGLALITGTSILLSPETPFPGAVALIPVAGAAAVLWSCEVAQRTGASVVRVLSIAPLQYIGRLSYSWYLWHWPVLVFAKIMIPNLTLAGRLAFAIASFGVAILAHHIVENPVRFSNYLASRRLASLALGAVTIVMGMACSRAAETLAKEAASKPEQLAFIDAARADAPIYRDACQSTRNKSYEFTDLSECSFGQATSKEIIVLFGDSFAMNWFPALEKMANDNGWRLVTLVRYLCPIESVLVYKYGPECSVWRQKAFRRIEELHPSVLVMSSDSYTYVGDADGKVRKLSYLEWESGAHASLTRLDAAGIETLLIQATPDMRVDVPTCLSRAATRGQSLQRCSQKMEAAVDERVTQAERDAAVGLPHVVLLNLSDVFCDGGTCAPFVRGVVAYRDAGHLSEKLVLSLTPLLEEKVKALLSKDISTIQH